jgi:signal transduction histidine kinase
MNFASSILDTHTKINDSIKMATNTQIPQFVNSVSHEIRAPLNAIAGYAEMIESEVFGELNDIRYKEFAQSIKSASIYALSIINELLDYSKLKAGGFMPQFEAVDVDKVVSEAIQTVYPLAVSRKIEIVKTILSGTPLINSDSRLLKQVLINLLTNAIKYSNDEKSVLLTAGLTKTGRVMFEITDFGRGMTKEQIHNALIPFNNAHKKEHNTASTGLGLSLSKELTELIHGRFMIDSVPNEKTRIRIIYEKTSLLNQP